MNTLGTTEQTNRGFTIIHFEDINGVLCSLQESSVAINNIPGSGALWIGCDEPKPRTLIPGKGWTPIAMPEDYIADTRMHLNRKQVKALIRHLKVWIKKGTLQP